jgi:hypothetical protein
MKASVSSNSLSVTFSIPSRSINERAMSKVHFLASVSCAHRAAADLEARVPYSSVLSPAECEHDKALFVSLAHPCQPRRVRTTVPLPHAGYRKRGIRHFLGRDRFHERRRGRAGDHYAVVAKNKALERSSYFKRLSGLIPSFLQWIPESRRARQIQGIFLDIGSFNLLCPI